MQKKFLPSNRWHISYTDAFYLRMMVPLRDRFHLLLRAAALNSCHALIKCRLSQTSLHGIHHPSEKHQDKKSASDYLNEVCISATILHGFNVNTLLDFTLQQYYNHITCLYYTDGNTTPVSVLPSNFYFRYFLRYLPV